MQIYRSHHRDTESLGLFIFLRSSPCNSGANGWRITLGELQPTYSSYTGPYHNSSNAYVLSLVFAHAVPCGWDACPPSDHLDNPYLSSRLMLRLHFLWKAFPDSQDMLGVSPIFSLRPHTSLVAFK